MMIDKNEIYEAVRKFWSAQEAYYNLLAKIKREDVEVYHEN